MKSIHIKKTYRTPELILDVDKGLIEINGKSVLENHAEFFAAFLKTLDEYVKSPNEKTIVNFNIDYLDSRSSKVFIQILKKIDTIFKNKKSIVLNWYLLDEDKDFEEMIKEYQAVLNVPINMIKTKA